MDPGGKRRRTPAASPVAFHFSSSQPPLFPFNQITGKVKSKLGTDTKKKVTKFAASKTFFNFAPCVLQETHTGIGAGLHGLNFAPELFGFHPTIGRASFSGLQIAPKLIFVNPMGLQVQPQVRMEKGGEHCLASWARLESWACLPFWASAVRCLP